MTQPLFLDLGEILIVFTSVDAKNGGPVGRWLAAAGANGINRTKRDAEDVVPYSV